MFSKAICERIFSFLGPSVLQRPFRVVFADGTKYQNYDGSKNPEIEIVFKNAKGQRRLILEGYVGFFESYINGDIDLNGENPVHSLTRLGLESGLMRKHAIPNPILLLKQFWWERKVSNRSWERARLNALAHYNLPGEFFRIVLGKTYGYCEGYYRHGYDGDDDQAQHDRFDHVCKKLLLKPGDKLVEVGSGWGYMSVLAAEKYGAEVVNYGIVPEQNAVLERMIKEKGLEGRARVVDRDHRALMEEPEKYDKYVSLGVYEHAGRWELEDWIKSISVGLKKGGIGVLASMFKMDDSYTAYLTTRYIFPGGYLPSLPRTLELMDTYNLHVLDAENLWHHYQRAVQYWAKNFRENWKAIHALDPKRFDERFRRIWTMYLEGCGEAFSEDWARLNVFHLTFTKGRHPDYYPATRDFLYTNS